jgi:CRISPR/Cas system CSM-associated protein Csm3 (group 7 of RAMP superfamily)
MNKQERKLKGQAKFKKRLKNHGLTQELLEKKNININCFKTTGKPCSCDGCSPGKIEEKAKYRLNKFDKNENIDE